MKTKRNWKTTLSGIALLLLAAVNISNNPAAALSQNNLDGLIGGLAGIGLIAAQDAKKEQK